MDEIYQFLHSVQIFTGYNSGTSYLEVILCCLGIYLLEKWIGIDIFNLHYNITQTNWRDW